MNQSNANNTLRSLRNVFNRKKDSPFSLPNSSSSSSQQFPSYPPPPYHLHHNPAATAPQHSNAKMGRKEFLKDVDALQTYFASLKPNDAKLVSDFKFHDPELTFTFTYGLRKTFNIVLYINSVNNYPTKFSGFLCVNDDSGDRAVTNGRFSGFREVLQIKSSRAFSREVLQAYSPSFATPSPSPRSFSSSSASGPLSSRQLLQRHLAECEHYLYKTHVFSADRFGFEVAIAFPAKRLGLSEDAATAWNLDVDRWVYIVCIMQFGTKYVDLQEIAKQVPNESDYGQLKEACKTTYPVSVKVLTSTTPNPKHFFSNARPTSVGSTSGGTSESSLQSPATAAPEADQFILSWTLTDHLGTNLLSLICDRIWWNLGWESVEFAAAERAADNRQFLNDARAAFRGEFDKCLEREIQFSRSAAHGLLSVLEQEQYEASAEARNENFLLLVVRYLRRRILLCPNYCLICHRRQAVEFSTLKPFVCNSQLCQHQAQSVGLGKIFETEMVGNEIVIDLLVSLCWAAVEVRALNPAPDQTVAASGLFPMDTNGLVRVVRIGRDGVIGRSTLGGQGYRVDGDVDTSNDNARPHPHSRDSPWSAQFQPGDLLSILNPETQQPLPLSTITLSTFARVVQVSDDHILIDQPVAIPASLALHNQRLPFRIHRKMEQHFVLPNSAPNLPNSKPDLSNSKPDYERLEAVLRKLPPVRTMVAYVHTGSLRRELDALDPLCYPLLSWIISSNRAHLRALDSERELVKVQGGLAAFSSGYSGYKTWRQFVMLMSSPEKEEEFQREKMRLKSESPNKGELYAWHGSRLENWHSIIRTALNFNKVLNGRAYGNGVYMASDAQTSYGYSQQYASNGKAKSQWPQSPISSSGELKFMAAFEE
ncbi:hypothetical protein BC938DRAFT_470661 [Jimgerdemannia flammicorona]|uniref:Poly [ADP-ribose] polymerase n=1 Tax=Jimgerdemannia flammicorona TaxID=994334 RepID=A0A433Q9Q0_9FUNG|nr:hypothetical protein BC938DRAFT_470661 [Jimgerdemannia flammicorona]